ncbi:MAG TPA: hypothetical protein VLK65_28050 [Vicinamibacteria bacterium]|nr:hypothetical protein [Vicinamibacteria bacterium]
MTHALVGDVANVIRIETLRATARIVVESTIAGPALGRTLSLRPGLIESSPAKRAQDTAHRA